MHDELGLIFQNPHPVYLHLNKVSVNGVSICNLILSIPTTTHYSA